MEYSRILVDTSIFVEYLRNKKKEKTILFNIPNETILFISTVTLFELYAGANDEQKWNDVKLLTEDLPILPFTTDLAEFAAKIFQDLKKRNQIIEFRDIFIASTAIMNDLPIQTLNIEHFNRINGLVII
jgi:predicted nucleic acid-binding protein